MDNFSRNKIFYKVRQTVLELLEDRKYNLPEEEKTLPFNEFSERLEEQQINLEGRHKDDENKLCYVNFFLESKTFGKKDLVNVREFINENYAKNDINVIIILQEKPTAQINKELTLEEYKNFEFFLAKQLMINITKHVRVPKHEIVSKEELEKVLEKFQANINQLPKILSTDPVAKYYGMKPGDVCKIKRNSPMTGETYYYRLVR